MKNPFPVIHLFLGEMVGDLPKAADPTRAEMRDSPLGLVVVSVIVVALVFLAIWWLARKGAFRVIRIFVGEMVGELKKASWPTRLELRDSTIVVIVASALLGLFTSISDFALGNVVMLFTDWVK